MPATKPLSDRQKAFIGEYMIDSNATQAAIRAGYSAKAAKEVGCRLLTYDHVKDEIAVRKQRQQIKCTITADEVLDGIRSIAYKEDARDNDRIRAFELLGKYLALFTEKQQVDQTVTGTMQVEFVRSDDDEE